MDLILLRAGTNVTALGQDLVAHKATAFPGPQICRRCKQHSFLILHKEAVISQPDSSHVGSRVVVAMGIAVPVALLFTQSLKG